MQWTLTGNIGRRRRKSSLGQLILLALAVELLLLASFTALQVPTATQHNLERAINSAAVQTLVYLPPHWQEGALQMFPVLGQPLAPVRYSSYVPIIPVAIFIGYTLGVPLGLLAPAIFLLIGIFGPWLGVLPFACGGGLDYCQQPTFGYLLGIALAAWFAGRITLTANSSWRQLLAVAGGLLLAHGLGLLYLLGGCLGLLLFEGNVAYLKWQPWLFENIRNLSWYTLPYDALFSLALVGLGFPFRWLNSVLTAPDTAMRARRRWSGQMEQVS